MLNLAQFARFMEEAIYMVIMKLCFIREGSILLRQILMLFSVSYFRKELHLRFCRHSGSASDGTT